MKENKEKVLFVNGCMRTKGISRTYAIANRFIRAYEAYHPKHEIIHLDLLTERIFPLTYFDIDMQEKDLWSKRHYAQQFADSDKIIIAAPVWNMTCPSALHAYIERICLPDTTYERSETGCSGKKALYITTMGGFKQPGTPDAAEYVQAIFARLGIVDFEEICVEGMDIKQKDAATFFKDAIKRCDALAEIW